MGKTLAKLVGGLAIILATATGCPLVPITPTPPKSTLSINPSYGKNPLTTNIKYTATDSESDVENYEVSIDVGEDGTLDEVISQSSPINVTRTYNTGKVKISGRCTDSAGLIDAKDAQIVVSASDIPTVDLSGVDAYVAETGTKIVNLPSPIDSDTPGVIPYTSAEVLTGDVTSILNGNQLTVQSNSPTSQETDYQIKLTFGTDEGGMNEATLESKILNLCGISGVLKNDVTSLGESGEIKAFDSEGNLLESTPASSNGSFNIQLSNPVSNIVLKGKLQGDGFNRIVRLDGKSDYSGLTVWAVPNPSFCTKEILKQDWIETNYAYGGTSRWEGLPNIEILYDNPKGTFTLDEQNIIENVTKASDGIERFVEGQQLDGRIQKDTIDTPPSAKHYNIVNGNIEPDIGWIILAHDETMPETGKCFNGYLNDNPATGIINKSVIYLRTVNDAITCHELGHSLIAPDGEAQTLSDTYTIMWTSGNYLTRPGDGDEMKGRILTKYPPKEPLEDFIDLD